jgi:hypothetical protein
VLLCYPRGDGDIYYSPYNGKQNWTRRASYVLMLPGGDGRELIRHYGQIKYVYCHGGTSRHGGDGRNIIFNVTWR